jgi:imidazolonepropionase-like amidohydrolase
MMVTMTEGPLAIVGARIVPIDGDPIDGGTVLVADGRITAVGGADLAVPDGATIVPADGRWVLPGLIDAHTHLGVAEEGEGPAGMDMNEMTDPNTAQVRAIDAIYPGDIGFRDAIAGGVLAVNVNPGSGNPIGGQTAAIKCRGRTVDAMLLRAPSGVKSALGENPKRVYGDRDAMPSTRLGTAAVLRQAFTQAGDYARRHAEPEPGKIPDRDLRLEVLAQVLRGELPWRQHCHRADDIATALRIAAEFGYPLVIDHGTEAHLLADLIAERGVPVIVGPLLGARVKVELRNLSFASPGLLAAAGVSIAITTDHPFARIGHLMLQVILAVKEGLDQVEGLRSVTINPARIMGVDDRLGSLTPGKDADLCIWSGDPLDAMSRVERAYLDGREIYRYDADRRAGTFA